MFTKEKINNLFKGEIIGKEIIFLESATSTNDVAAEVGRKREDPEGIVIIADAQTRGRGRLGRAWISPPGVNLYFTVLLKPPFSPAEAPFLTLTAAVAVAASVRRHTGLKAEIKWPNDIYFNSKKAGGILLEMKADKDRISLLSVGVGLNVNMSMNELPEEITSLSTSLKAENRRPVDRTGLLGAILAEMERAYKILLQGNKRALINEWIHLNCTLGHEIIAKDRDRVISGTAENINDRGELIVRMPDGGTEILNAGEVTVLKIKTG
ncbi:MAG: biotin--[acetyl-CoA-carboxylase] ligase [Nitrospiraceae bacterium]|nr:MAG: biotin--[acetyl-CoA-carboxylase] ligase [Nitrospiraceae bacterium]